MSNTECSLVTTIDVDYWVVTVSGELDAYTAPRLRQALYHARRGGATRIVVDMAAVTFVDSAAIGVLLRAYMLGDDVDVPLIIRNPSTRVNQVIDVLRLRSIFPVTSPIDAATA